MYQYRKARENVRVYTEAPFINSKSSTIFCSQFRQEGWYEQLGGDNSTIADAILDRIVHDAYKINIESIDPSKDISMRELYGLDKSLSE